MGRIGDERPLRGQGCGQKLQQLVQGSDEGLHLLWQSGAGERFQGCAVTLAYCPGHLNERFEVAAYEPPNHATQEWHGREPRQQGTCRHTGRHGLTHAQGLRNLNDVVVVSQQIEYAPGTTRRRYRGQTQWCMRESREPWM